MESLAGEDRPCREIDAYIAVEPGDHERWGIALGMGVPPARTICTNTCTGGIRPAAISRSRRLVPRPSREARVGTASRSATANHIAEGLPAGRATRGDEPNGATLVAYGQ